MHSDPLADMLARVKNAALVGKTEVRVPRTKMNLAVLSLMLENNYLEKIETDASAKFPTLVVKLKYTHGTSAIQHLKRISKPGVRIYRRSSDLKTPLSGYGLTIVSTSRGVMTISMARKNKLGGEVLVELW